VAIEASGLSRAFLPLLSAAIEALIDVADPGKGVSGLQQRALDAPRSCYSFVADSCVKGAVYGGTGSIKALP
jgi:hypothetical protein